MADDEDDTCAFYDALENFETEHTESKKHAEQPVHNSAVANASPLSPGDLPIGTGTKPRSELLATVEAEECVPQESQPLSSKFPLHRYQAYSHHICPHTFKICRLVTGMEHLHAACQGKVTPWRSDPHLN